MKENRIELPGAVFENGQIIDGNCFVSNSISGDELTIDTMKVTADYSWMMPTLLAPSDADILMSSEERAIGLWPYFRVRVADPEVYEYGAPVRYYHDGKLIGLFYVAQRPKRVGTYNYEITCTSAIGLLDNSTHYGGMYTGQPMADVLEDIISGIVEYALDPDFADVPVYGWLPVSTRRENLHQLLFAEGCCVKKAEDGTLHFTRLTTDTPVDVSADRMFLGGTVDYGAPATKVSVSEHAYIAYDTDKEATLFEGEAATEPIVTPAGTQMVGALVVFGGPMHDLHVNNGTILESGVNYAVLGQSSDCKLTGKEYTHTIRVISKPEAVNARALVSRKDNEVSVTDATLVSLANSENVANRVMAYYGNAQTTTVDLVVQDERPGAAVTFDDPYGDHGEGFIQSLDLTMSGILRASAALVSGYVPGEIGNYFQHHVLLTAGTVWTVPAECKGKIRVALIGGGQGGYSGAKGEDGERPNGGVYGKSGAGGAAGAGGDGGKIFVVTLNVSAGMAFSAQIGAGGAGGVCGAEGEAGAGADGGATRFGPYSSANGNPSATGYANLFSGTVYALPGVPGIKGGKGASSDGENESVIYKGVTYTAGANGKYVEKSGPTKAYGGLGGGAAAGADGKPGNDGKISSAGLADGGPGGDGAVAAGADNAVGYGSGGPGGHGGGGGGGGAVGKAPSSHDSWDGDGGGGGTGGRGGNGAPGCIIIYY